MTSTRVRQPFMADQSVGQLGLDGCQSTLSVDCCTVHDRHSGGKQAVHSPVSEKDGDQTITAAKPEGERIGEKVGEERERVTSTTVRLLEERVTCHMGE